MTQKADEDRVALSTRLTSLDVIEGHKVRRFDDTDTWEFLN